MSKLARKPIDVTNVEVSFDENKVLIVKGKEGSLQLNVISEVNIEIDKSELYIKSDNNAYLGLYCALIRNMVSGVNDMFTETLTLNGVGYRASISNNEINFNLGFSHPVKFKIVDNVKVTIVSPTEILLKSCDKQLLGQVAANIIKLRPAKKDPYKFKGIKRINDKIMKKAGKKVK